jgi:succinyl-CoA synthetase alpha subunit
VELFVEVRKNTYIDSILTLAATSLFMDQEGVEKANVGMGTQGSKEVFASLGMVDSAIDNAENGDLVIAMFAENREVFEKVLAKLEDIISPTEKDSKKKAAYSSFDRAISDHHQANICLISVPGEYARTECEKALNAGLHVMLFSSSVSGEDELAIKTLAREKGLLCMGPDCGVVNLNGIAFILASINNSGPFGICGASGCGIQHIAALLHANGSGITQGIGTGGNDLKAPVYGITMLMGIDALEDDPDTKYIILVSRKPNEISMKRVLDRVSTCKKPVVVCFMGCDREPIEAAGGIYASNLDDAAVQAMKLVGKDITLITEDELNRMAEQAVSGMRPEQKYVRGLFDGGTYCDEAIGVLTANLGTIYSNVASNKDLRLKDSMVSVENTCIDYGEEEFTQGKPHPTLAPGIRSPHVLREGADPEAAVLLFDFINSPSAPKDIMGGHIQEIKKAMELHKNRGGKLAVVASICGTDADIQGLKNQKEQLRAAGVLLCPTNYTAAKLAAKIVKLQNGGKPV